MLFVVENLIRTLATVSHVHGIPIKDDCEWAPVLYASNESMIEAYNSTHDTVMNHGRYGKPLSKLMNSLVSEHKEEFNFASYSSGSPRDSIPHLHPVLWDMAHKPNQTAHNRSLHGHHYMIVANFAWNFGHILHDHLPLLSHLRDLLQQPGATPFKIIIEDSPLMEKLTKFIDGEFASENLEYVNAKTIIKVEGPLTVVDGTPHFGRHRELSLSLGNWLNEVHAPSSLPPCVIWYTRRSHTDEDASDENVTGTASHGRVVDVEHERHALDIVQAIMKKYNRTEKLIIFDGTDHTQDVDAKSGAHPTMSFEKQYELFNSATLVVGPHGSGLANVLWMNSRSKDCSQRPTVIEFLSWPGSLVQVGGFGKTYWNLFGGIPWVRYTHVVYAANSTQTTTYIDLEDLKAALEAALAIRL